MSKSLCIYEAKLDISLCVFYSLSTARNSSIYTVHCRRLFTHRRRPRKIRVMWQYSRTYVRINNMNFTMGKVGLREERIVHVLNRTYRIYRVTFL